MSYLKLVEDIVDSLLNEALYDNETKADRGSYRRSDLADIIRVSRNERTIPYGPGAHISQFSGKRLRFHALDTPENWAAKAHSDIGDREEYYDGVERRANIDAEENGWYNDGWGSSDRDADIAHLEKAQDYADKKVARLKGK